jgi:hypothetical protein
MNFFEPQPDGFHARFAVVLAAEETAEPGALLSFGAGGCVTVAKWREFTG